VGLGDNEQGSEQGMGQVGDYPGVWRSDIGQGTAGDGAGKQVPRCLTGMLGVVSSAVQTAAVTLHGDHVALIACLPLARSAFGISLIVIHAVPERCCINDTHADDLACSPTCLLHQVQEGAGARARQGPVMVPGSTSTPWTS
jgi:hypothetical protein